MKLLHSLTYIYPLICTLFVTRTSSYSIENMKVCWRDDYQSFIIPEQKSLCWWYQSLGCFCHDVWWRKNIQRRDSLTWCFFISSRWNCFRQRNTLESLREVINKFLDDGKTVGIIEKVTEYKDKRRFQAYRVQYAQLL